MPRTVVDTPLRHSSAMQELIEQHERARCLAIPLAPPASYKPLKGLIHHYERGEPEDCQFAAQGLRVTKFGRGFQRRNVPPPVDPQERERIEREREERAAKNAAERREYLRRQQQRNGVQVITAEPLEGYQHKEYRRRAQSAEPSEATQREADAKFRTSEYRYYTLPPSGEAHHRRQDLMRREGLIVEKKTSVLGVGRADLPSYGVEDQFSKSEYFEREKPCVGLVETSRPGAYTPRKLAHPIVTSRWPPSGRSNTSAQLTQRQASSRAASTNRQVDEDIALVRALA